MGRFIKKLAKGERAKLKMLREKLNDAEEAAEIRDIAQAIDALEARIDKDKENKEKRRKAKEEKAQSAPATPEAAISEVKEHVKEDIQQFDSEKKEDESLLKDLDKVSAKTAMKACKGCGGTTWDQSATGDNLVDCKVCEGTGEEPEEPVEKKGGWRESDFCDACKMQDSACECPEETLTSSCGCGHSRGEHVRDRANKTTCSACSCRKFKKTAEFHDEWKAFFDEWKALPQDIRERAEDTIVQEACDNLPDGADFGSSDKWHSVYGVFSSRHTPGSLEAEVREYLGEADIKDSYSRNVGPRIAAAPKYNQCDKGTGDFPNEKPCGRSIKAPGTRCEEHPIKKLWPDDEPVEKKAAVCPRGGGDNGECSFFTADKNEKQEKCQYCGTRKPKTAASSDALLRECLNALDSMPRTTLRGDAGYKDTYQLASAVSKAVAGKGASDKIWRAILDAFNEIPNGPENTYQLASRIEKVMDLGPGHVQYRPKTKKALWADQDVDLCTRCNCPRLVGAPDCEKCGSHQDACLECRNLMHGTSGEEAQCEHNPDECQDAQCALCAKIDPHMTEHGIGPTPKLSRFQKKLAEGAEEFKVGAISSNTNSFGLTGIILIGRDGNAWEVARSQGVEPLAVGDTVKIPKAGNGELNWAAGSFEIPKQIFINVDKEMLEKLWGSSGAPMTVDMAEKMEDAPQTVRDVSVMNPRDRGLKRDQLLDQMNALPANSKKRQQIVEQLKSVGSRRKQADLMALVQAVPELVQNAGGLTGLLNMASGNLTEFFNALSPEAISLLQTWGIGTAGALAAMLHKEKNLPLRSETSEGEADKRDVGQQPFRGELKGLASKTAADAPNGEFDDLQTSQEYALMQSRFQDAGGKLCEFCSKPTDGEATCTRHEPRGNGCKWPAFCEGCETGTCQDDGEEGFAPEESPAPFKSVGAKAGSEKKKVYYVIEEHSGAHLTESPSAKDNIVFSSTNRFEAERALSVAQGRYD